MSEYLAKRVYEITNIKLDSVSYDDEITLNCNIHGQYIKTVNQILYKNPKCPECVRLAKNKKLSEIGKTKVGELNSFYGHTHSKETKQKLSEAWSGDTSKRRKKISETVKSEECQKRIKQTRLHKYGSEVYVNQEKMKVTKKKLLDQYAKDNNCILLSEVTSKYGYLWINKNIAEIIIYKAHAFVKLEDLPKIIEFYNNPTLTPNSGMSYKEKALVDYIKSFYFGEVLENKRKIIYPQELDIYLPELKLAIEFNGNYWHAIERNTPKDYHLKKSLACKEKGIRLIHIYEFEDIEEQKQLLKDLILGIDKYPKNDFNKNNFITPIPKLYKNETNKGTIYSIGPIIKKEEI